MFLSALKVLIALIRPMVPMEIRSSTPTQVLSNFLAIYTTSRRLCSISRDRASVSSSVPRRAIISASFLLSSGGGRISAPPI